MYYIKNSVEAKITIDKSEFIGVLTYAENSESFSSILKAIKQRYPKATHYCSAYILGEFGDNQGSNDDFEPSGTAGVPILEMLRIRKLTNVYMVVVRYFGGIKLGAGGLIRAYTKITKETLNNALIYEKIKAPVFQVLFDYSFINVFEQKITNDIIVLNKVYDTKVTYKIACLNDSIKIIDDLNNHFISVAQLDDIEIEKDVVT